ncbi:MAG TPA: ATP-binding protein, partial [Bryobacteraceae bacterium]|nr:ATP-binding protein [Bryobacteraceae bacterium]
VMGVVPGTRTALDPEHLRLLELFANQTALAIERTASQHAAEEARIQMQSEEMRSSLLSAVSHDLRTPLASITGAASTLRSQGDKLSPDTRNELLDSIADEAERLGRLVANLIDITRLESGVELRRDGYPLEEIVGSVLQRMERQLRQRPIETHLPENLPLVYVDDVLMGQLLVNLLENANKYTPEGTAIELAAEAGADAVILEIRDRGPGFAEGDERRIFEKFYRRNVKGVRGVGLGLPICRAIVEAHRGTIEAFNREGGGAVFRVRLPMARQV